VITLIIIKSNNYTIRANGTLKVKMKKRGRIVTDSTNGVKDESYTRRLKTYDLNISKMTQGNYNNLLDMYGKENSFTVEDTDRNIFDGQFFIDTNEFSLQENENKKEKGYYYNGSTPLEKY